MYGNTELSNDQLRRVAPSIFAEAARDDRSERYTFIPTIAAVDGLRNEGWIPVQARQSRSRIEGNREFAKHMLRFRRHDATPVVGDVFPELVLTNSHDGASAYNLMAGMFRLACSNGMTVASGQFDKLTVRHSGNAIDNVIEGSYRVVEHLPRMASEVEKMRAIQLDSREQLALATSALALRYEPESAPIQAEQLLRARRYADQGHDLWTVFNRLQENITKGGVRGTSATGRRMSTRAINSVGEDIRTNRALWMLAESMAALKS